MKYYQRHIGDIMKKTFGLSLADRGAYDLMMDIYYDTERPLPLDPEDLYMSLGAKTKTDQRVIDSMLRRFFDRQDDGWHNDRCDEEIAAFRAKSKSASKSADAMWEKKRAEKALLEQRKAAPGDDQTESVGNADVMRTHSVGNANHEPLTNNHPSTANRSAGTKPKRERPKEPAYAPPDWVPAVPWADFVEARKKAGKPMTYRAQELAVMQLEAMREGGQDPAAVLNQSVIGGWTSLRPVRADFGAPPQSEAARRSGLSPAGQATAAAAERWIADDDGEGARH